MGLKPFFCFFGGKWRVGKYYRPPRHGALVEPFAGGAGYSLRHHTRRVFLADSDPVICGVWDYLIKVTEGEVMRLPEVVNHIDDVSLPQEAKWLIGFWLNKASVSPGLTPSFWMRSGVRPNSHWGRIVKERIASQVGSIRHWRVMNRSYESLGGLTATWFIDPPYQGKCGELYRHKIKDYESLAGWCLSRPGQVIVCEREGATWLPFQPFRKIKTTEGSRGKKSSKEVVWYGENNGPSRVGVDGGGPSGEVSGR